VIVDGQLRVLPGGKVAISGAGTGQHPAGAREGGRRGGGRRGRRGGGDSQEG
jgi:hypothetical protein